MATATTATVEMTKKMADAGANAVLVVTPCFYKASMSNDAMFSHFAKVLLLSVSVCVCLCVCVCVCVC